MSIIRKASPQGVDISTADQLRRTLFLPNLQCDANTSSRSSTLAAILFAIQPHLQPIRLFLTLAEEK